MFLAFQESIPTVELKTSLELNASFLNFTVPWWGGGEISNPLLVRECYSLFYDVMKRENESRLHGTLLITGTPGTGKSAFGIYAVWKLYSEGVSVLYEVKKQDSILFANQPIDGLVSEAGIYVIPFLNREEVINELCLIKELVRVRDPIDQDIIVVRGACFNLIVSSPDDNKFKDLFKSEARTLLMYMDLWSEIELKTLANTMRAKGIKLGIIDFTEDLILERFEKFGGSARQIFNLDADKNLIMALQAVDTNSLADLLTDNKLKGNLSGILIHRKPISEDKCLSSIDIASPYIARQLLDKYMLNNLALIRTFVASYRGVKDMQSMRGVVYEALMHTKLVEGGTFKLEDEKNSKRFCASKDGQEIV
jgi:hypothetical protein